MKYLILLNFIIIFFNSSAGGETIETKLLSAQQDLYNAKYQLAQQKFLAIAKEYPLHPAGHFFQAMTNLWQLGFAPDNTGLIKNSLVLLKIAQNLAERALKANKQESEMFFWRGMSSGVIAICETLLESAPEQRNPSLFISSIIGQLKIFRLFQSTINDLQQSLKKNPEFTDAQLGLALFDLYLGGGNQKKGVKQLWSVIDKGKYMKVEASYLLMDFLFGQGTDEDLLYRAIPTSLGLSMQFPNNLLFSLTLAKLYYEVGNVDEAKAILTEILNGNNKPYQNYIIDEARYFLGTIAFNQENYLLGIEHYNPILASKPKLPSYVLPWTYFRSAQCYWKLGNIDRARAMLNHTLKTENVNNVHNEANQLLKILSKN